MIFLFLSTPIKSITTIINVTIVVGVVFIAIFVAILGAKCQVRDPIAKAKVSDAMPAYRTCLLQKAASPISSTFNWMHCYAETPVAGAVGPWGGKSAITAMMKLNDPCGTLRVSIRFLLHALAPFIFQ